MPRAVGWKNNNILSMFLDQQWKQAVDIPILTDMLPADLNRLAREGLLRKRVIPGKKTPEFQITEEGVKYLETFHSDRGQ